MKQFFTSDTHFGSLRTMQFSRRPFSSTEEMDKEFIKNWNALIGKDDLVYHLGDFGDYEKLKELNGNVILILGNYEKEDLKTNFNDNFDKFEKYLISKGFKKIIKDGIYIELNGERVYLTHKPTDCNKEVFNLFGHIHEKSLAKRFGLNVGIDCYHYKPATMEDVLFYKNAIENYYDDDVFCEK